MYTKIHHIWEELSEVLNFTNDKKELFFSKFILLTEGPTELCTIPIFADRLGLNFENKSILPIDVGSKNSFYFYLKILKELKIPYVVVCDSDAAYEISSKGLPTIFNQLIKCDYLPDEQIARLKEIYLNQIEKISTSDRKYINEILTENDIYCFKNDFEKIFDENEYPELKEILTPLGNRNKPYKGQIIANWLIDNEKLLPDEILTLISFITEKYEGIYK